MVEEPPSSLVDYAVSGNADAQSDLGRFYGERGDTDKAMLWFRRAADHGLPRAKHNLGVLTLQLGRKEEAVRWLSEAAEAGWLNSVAALGAFYKMEGDVPKARQFYERAAMRGHGDSMAALGAILHAENTPEAHRVAISWCHRAAGQQNAAAMTTLGMLLNEGVAYPRDVKGAHAWFFAAAKLGHAGGQVFLGAGLELGLIGGAPNFVDAMAWYAIAIRNGHPFGAVMYASLDKRLAPAQRAAVPARLDAIVALWPGAFPKRPGPTAMPPP